MVAEAAIRSFPRGSAGGPSGLRPQHLQDALIPGWADEVLRQCTSVINLLAQGRAPESVRPWPGGATLTALPKPTGDHCPIASGETLRRLVGKALCQTVQDDIRAYLEPVQVGVGCPLACEAVIHVVRRWLAVHADDTHRVLFKLDLSNAFNNVDRSAFRAACRRVCPTLAPWVDWT